MPSLKKVLLSACLLSSILTAAATPKVVSAIYPLQQIANAIVGEPTELVADSYLSPHDYSIKPSDAKKILDADLFIWSSEQMIPQLRAHVKRRTEQHKVTINASRLPDIQLITLNKQHKHEPGDSHNHHITFDPHLWLSPSNAKVIATAIARKLSQIDADNEAHYQKNLKQFITQLDEETQTIKVAFAEKPPRPYFVFHDAYRYFEQAFGIKHIATIRAHAGQTPRARHLVELKQQLKNMPNACLFREPQFSSPLIERIVADSNVKVSTLDPIGYQKGEANKNDGYVRILHNIAMKLQSCGQ